MANLKVFKIRKIRIFTLYGITARPIDQQRQSWENAVQSTIGVEIALVLNNHAAVVPLANEIEKNDRVYVRQTVSSTHKSRVVV